MKLCSLISGSGTGLGIVTPGGIADMAAAGCTLTLDDVIKGAAVPGLTGEEKLISPSDAVFGNICSPGKIPCVGLNYKKHAQETGGTPPAQPVIFSKFNDCLSPAGGSIELPPWLRCFDYEAELVAVIGRTAWNVTPQEAKACVFGYTCGNDLSARDSQFISNQWLIGKTCPGFGPCGPYVVTADEFDPDEPHSIVCTRNGVTVQSDDVSDMIFPVAETVSYISRYCRLEPGDLIFTGTPSGVVLGQPKGSRNWLKRGETLCVTIEGIGTLENTLV